MGTESGSGKTIFHRFVGESRQNFAAKVDFSDSNLGPELLVCVTRRSTQPSLNLRNRARKLLAQFAHSRDRSREVEIRSCL